MVQIFFCIDFDVTHITVNMVQRFVIYTGEWVGTYCTMTFNVSMYRFGKVLWFNLSGDALASDDPWDVKAFAEFVFSGTNHSIIFNTE